MILKLIKDFSKGTINGKPSTFSSYRTIIKVMCMFIA